MVKTKRYNYQKGVSHSVSNILLGNGTKRVYRGKNPYGDFDKDGVLNAYDCNPYNYNQQGFFSGAVSSAKSLGQSIKGLFTGKSGAEVAAKEKSQTIANLPTTPTGTKVITSGTTPGSAVITTIPVKSGGGSSGGGGGSVSPMFGGSSTPSVFTPTTSTTSTTTVPTNNLGLGNVNLGKFQTRATIENLRGNETLKEQFNRERKQIAAGIPGVIATFFPKKEPVIPTILSTSQQLGYQKTGTINTNQQVGTADLWRLGYKEEAGKQELGLFGFGQQIKIDKIAEQEAQKVSQELQNVGKTNIDFTYKIIQNRVNNGELSAEAGQKELDKYVKSENERLNKQFKNKFNENMSPYIKEAEKVTGEKAEELNKKVNRIGKEYALSKGIESGIVGFGIMAVSTILPPLGLAFGAYSGVTQVAALPETISYAKQDPWGFGASVTGGVIGGSLGYAFGKSMINIANTEKVNTYLSNKKLTQKDLQVINTITHSKAIKVGVDEFGNTLWKVTQKGMTKVINKKTGAVIDKSISFSDLNVVAKTADEAVKSAVSGTAISLRRSGWRLTQNGNQLNIKGQTAYLQGQATTYPTSVQNLRQGTGTYDIFTGKFGGKVRDIGIKIKASVANKNQYSATSNFFDIILGRKPSVVKTGKGNLAGIKTKSLTFAETDISPNFYFTKRGVAKRFKTEQIPTRDYSMDWGTSFEPKVFQYSDLDFINNLDTPANLQQVSQVSSKANAQAVAKSAYQAQMSALSAEKTNAILGGFKSTPAPTLIKPKVLPGVVSSVLIESNYPTIVGGTKQNEWTGLSMTGNVVNDYSVESTRVPSQTKTKVDSVIDYQSKYSYKPLSNLLNIQQPQLKTITKTQTGIKTNVGSIQNIFLGTSQIQQQQYKLQTKQLQVQTPTFAIHPFTFPTYSIPRPPKPKAPQFSSYPKYGDYFYKPKKTKKGKQKYKYQSSLGAFQLGITNKKYDMNTLLGVGLRPMITGNKKETFDADYRKRLNKLITT